MSYEEQIMFKDKYPSIFSPQMVTIVFIILQIFFATRAVLKIDDFTVVGLVTWPLNGSEAGGDLVLIQTSLLLLCKSSCSYAD